MKTLEEAAGMTGVSIKGKGLNLHFSPIPNWYMKCGTVCPICDNPVYWEWSGEIPAITNEITSRGLKPIVTSANLLAHGHRWLQVSCDKCSTTLFAENFD